MSPLAASADDEVQLYSGEVMLDVSLDGWIFVALDESPADGAADRIFVLQREAGATGGPKGPVRSTARLMRRHHSVVVQLADPGWRVALSLPPEDPVLLRQAHLGGPKGAPGAAVDVLEGYGLAEYHGPFAAGESVEESLRSLMDRQAERRKDDVGHLWAAEEPPGGPEGGGSSGAVTCKSGGCGSIQCSIGGCVGSPSNCSTTCAGDTFSCCNCGVLGAECECESNSEC